MNDVDTDLLIVGAGPTGLAAGVDALRHGLTVRVVEQRAERALLSKALVVHARTMEVFEAQGIAERVRQRGQTFKALNVRPVRDMKPIRIDLVNRPWGDTRYGAWLSVPQYEVERVLEERFLELGGRIDWGHALEAVSPHDTHVEAKISGTTHRARWGLACDGGRSTAREQVGVSLPRKGLGATFALTDVWTKSELAEDEGNVVLSADGVLLIVPMPEPGVWRLIAHVRGDFDPTSLDAWAALVRERAGVDLQMQRLGWNSRFDLTGGVADRFREGRIFLLGDAAHVHSPVGGQGLNTGVQDAHNLVWKLAMVTRNEVTGEAAERLLESYERERRPTAAAMVKVTGFATRVLTLKNPVLRFVRGVVGRVLVRLPLFQNRLSRPVGMLDLEADGCRRVENPRLRDGRRLHDALHPLKPTLLRYEGRERLVRPDRIVAGPELIPISLAERVEVA